MTCLQAKGCRGSLAATRCWERPGAPPHTHTPDPQRQRVQGHHDFGLLVSGTVTIRFCFKVPGSQ